MTIRHFTAFNQKQNLDLEMDMIPFAEEEGKGDLIKQLIIKFGNVQASKKLLKKLQANKD